MSLFSKEKNVTNIYTVNGMSCKNCVAHVNKAISALDGVKKVAVDLDNSQAKIEYNPDKVTPQQMQQAVKDAGYEFVL